MTLRAPALFVIAVAALATACTSNTPPPLRHSAPASAYQEAVELSQSHSRTNPPEPPAPATGVPQVGTLKGAVAAGEPIPEIAHQFLRALSENLGSGFVTAGTAPMFLTMAAWVCNTDPRNLVFADRADFVARSAPIWAEHQYVKLTPDQLGILYDLAKNHYCAKL